MGGPTPIVLGLISWIFLTGPQLTDAVFCDFNSIIYDEQTAKCADFTAMVVQSYYLNKTASGFTGMTDAQVQQLITNAMIKPATSPLCVFSKQREVTVQKCCPGWQGLACDNREYTNSMEGVQKNRNIPTPDV